MYHTPKNIQYYIMTRQKLKSTDIIYTGILRYKDASKKATNFHKLTYSLLHTVH